MRYLFVHQNMPGQFGNLARHLAAQPCNEVAFVTRRSGGDLPGVTRVTYELRTPKFNTHIGLGSDLWGQSLFGDAVVAACRALMLRGFEPDVIIGHPGWGELLFVKDLFPNARLVCYCEFYHRPDAPFFHGDPPAPLSLTERKRRRAGSAHLLLSLEAADRGWSPTKWQKSGFPDVYQDKIHVAFDGVDTHTIAPREDAAIVLPDGSVIRHGDEVLTFAARSLEPSRGFPTFWRSLPALLQARPQLKIVIVGNESPHYDVPPQGASTWLRKLQRDTPLDSSRVYLLGWLDRQHLTTVLQTSRLHTYLSIPTVLSWSMIEAMSAGCVILGSDTPPVTEMITDGKNGFLTDFADSCELAQRAAILLGEPHRKVGLLARRFVEDHLSVDRCIADQVAIVSHF